MSLEKPRTSQEKTALNRERALKRREVARTVRDVRERLNSSTGSPLAFDHELMMIYAKNRLSAAFALPLFAVIVGAITFLWMEAFAIGIWLFCVLLSHMLIISACRTFERTAAPDQNLKATHRQFVIGDLLYGLCWAGFFLLPPDKGAQNSFEILQFATMLIVIAMGTMLSSAIPRALVAGTLPITIAIAFSFLHQQTPIHYAMMAMAVGAQGFFLMLGNQLHTSTRTMLEYRAEKDHLIAELEQANAISDKSRRRAEEANLAKSRFLATMSHELRTPLNAILGFSEVIKSELLGPISNSTYREYAGDIHSSGGHLLNLINEILDLSRIEAGKYELSEEAVQLTTILEDCRHMMAIRARNKNITITEAFETGLPKLWADERAVRQVILNLISNAVKFTPANGEVQLKCGWTASGGQYVIIKDNGPGIAEEEIPIVMQAFGQGSIAIKSAEEGTGLGLSIVQALVTMHSGKFELKSKLREGTEAIVTFPSTRVLEAMPAFQGDGYNVERRARPAQRKVHRRAS